MLPFDFQYTPPQGPSRSDAARQGREVLEILAASGYCAPSGRRVELGERIERARAATRDYPPDAPVEAPSGRRTNATELRVVNGTSLSSARRIAERGSVPFVLNFASAKNPGGGFLGGARAQEESLARSSALCPCLEKSAMYAHHRAQRDCLYTSWMVHSPAVPVFRDDETGALLESPYDVAFLTAPAPNAKCVLARAPDRAAEIVRAMEERVARALAIAAAHGHGRLVLGAWGCGVFGNDPRVVAEAFGRELEGPFAGVFDEIVFAVLDWSPERRFIRPFVERFASAA